MSLAPPKEESGLLSGLEGDDAEQRRCLDRTGGRGGIGKVDLKRGIDFIIIAFTRSGREFTMFPIIPAREWGT